MTSIGHHITLVGSLFGGFMVALVVTPLLTGLTDEAPAPTDLFWAKYLGDGSPEEYTTQGTLLHLACGACAGVPLGAMEPELPLQWPVHESVRAGQISGALNGAIYGLALSVLAALVFRYVLHLDVDRRRLWLIVRFHLPYGVVLGLLYGWYLNLGSSVDAVYSAPALQLGLDAFLVFLG